VRYNWDETVRLDVRRRSKRAVVAHPRLTAATAVGSDKLPDDLPRKDREPGSASGREGRARKALFPDFSYDTFELTKIYRINQE
jgi:hypothetical protein